MGKFLGRVALASPLILCLCCLAFSLMRLPAPGIELGAGKEGVPGRSRTGGGAAPPGGGSCANIGVDYPGNPFRGWPVIRFFGDWKVISSWFCDPTYFRGYTHWGIDLAARVTRDTWGSLDGAEVMSTTDLAVVLGATDDGGWHFGMGNHVKLMHVACDLRCGSLDEPTEKFQWLFLEEASSPECSEPTPTPNPHHGDPDWPTPVPILPDLILDCRGDGWKATYMHLRAINVEAGQLVERSQVLGWIDNTGNSTGTHLHYQINGPDLGAIDPGPAMCPTYSNELRAIDRWLLPVCDFSPYFNP